MAHYTAYAGPLCPGMPGSIEDGVFYYPIFSNVLVVDDNSTVLLPGDNDPVIFPSTGLLPLSSTEPMEAGDDVNDWRRKLQGNFAPQYPQITADDVVTWVWM